jgi:sugar phosphate isomerase/epimerase
MTPGAAQFAVNTYSYTQSHRVRDCVAALADRGYAEFELMMFPGHLWPAEIDAAARRELRRYLADRGVNVRTLNMPNVDLNVAGATAEMRAYTLGILRKVVELAGDLGAPGVVIGPGKQNPLMPAPIERMLGHFFTALDELVPLAERAGTSLYVENMPFAFLPGIGELLAALDRYGNAGIGVVYDVANGHFIGEDVPAALRRCRERLRVVHLSDTGQDVYRHDAVGLGTVDFAAVPAVLAEIGHDDRPILEIIAVDADRAIDDSATRLAGLGWPKQALAA